MNGRLLKIGEVVEITSLHRATIYRLIKAGDFPNRRKISPQRVGWRSEQVEAWRRGEWHSSRGPSGGPDQPDS